MRKPCPRGRIDRAQAQFVAQNWRSPSHTSPGEAPQARHFTVTGVGSGEMTCACRWWMMLDDGGYWWLMVVNSGSSWWQMRPDGSWFDSYWWLPMINRCIHITCNEICWEMSISSHKPVLDISVTNGEPSQGRVPPIRGPPWGNILAIKRWGHGN